MVYPTPPQPFTNRQLNNTIGLYGVSCAQILYYYRHYPKDRRGLKLFVCRVFSTLHFSAHYRSALLGRVLDTSGTITHTLTEFRNHYKCQWVFNVTYHANPISIKSTPAVFMIDVFLTVSMPFNNLQRINQSYLLRDPPFSSHKVNSNIIEPKSYRFIETITMLFASITGAAQLFIAEITDIYIAVSLSLLSHGMKTGLPSSNNLIMRLILYTFNRGIVTALVWMIFHFAGSKYTNPYAA
ncbi:predicted protein [Postia placenta Mad-698-R]|uniref:DUF6534 domain-containing protein n=1 Tax=Postia placenta MAD-698-R-SB12 TaxID=670580 RepID=A0A1X6NBR9_9APHY|nr:hypothetical protein POSPLADRAFT_1131816 [Postia placenta MAD-698-R-SB12]EED81564.1 predicted protein [Postia placenta Mad-698-R]OSX65952.1 hypothetical protein POSPLADRAFT_1131816 [Postia placenta MAD-698-R-SB12]